VFSLLQELHVIRVQFEIEQDEDADMFVASWDESSGRWYHDSGKELA